MTRQERPLTAREAWQQRQQAEPPRPKRPDRPAKHLLANLGPWWSAAKGWLFAVALVAAVLLTYRPVWRAGFIWDDDLHLTLNPVLAPGGWLTTWMPGTHVNYWPVNSTVYRIQYAIWDLNPAGYHVVNLVIFALAAIMVWRVLDYLRVPGAMFAAALFALHPVNVESAAWITQQKNTLSLLFTLISLLCYMKFERRGGGWRYALSVGIFVLAALSKGMTLTMWIVLLACAWWQRGRITRRDLVRVIPFLLIGVLMALEEVALQHSSAGRMGVTMRTDDLLSRVAVAGCAVWFYFWKLIWPVNLVFVYPHWNVAKWHLYSLVPFLPGVLLVLLLALGWWKRHTWGRPLLMLMICYVGLLGPVLGFADIYFMRFSLVADHWQYAAMIAPCALFAGLATVLARRWRWSRLAGRVLGVALLAVLANLSFRQSRNYTDMETLWRSVIAGNPDCWLAHGNLGQELDGQGRLAEAVAEYNEAIRIYPECIESLNNLGHVFALQGQLDEAIARYRKAIVVNPKNTTIHGNLAAALAACGQLDEAIDEYRIIRDLSPYDLSVCLPLGVALVNRGRFDEAIVEYRAVLKVAPNYADVHYLLGNALAAQGSFDEAAEHFRKAQQIKPSLLSAQGALDRAILQRERVRSTLIDWRESLRAHPDDVARLNDTAWLLATNPTASIRNGAEAVRLAEQAVRLSGGREPAILGTLAAAYAEAGRFPEAVKTAGQAADLAAQQEKPNLAQSIRVKQALYKAKTPCRQPPAPPPQ